MTGLKKLFYMASQVILALALCLPQSASGQEAQAVTVAQAAAPACRLINIEGDVTVRPAGSDQWAAARRNHNLYAGDTVRTGEASRASILCRDESQIKLNENTVLILKQVAPSSRLRLGEIVPAAEAGAQSIYQVPHGEIWLRNKYENFRFELETPSVTAALRGTELNVRVRPDGATSVILLDGKICLINPQGEVCLLPGEEGRAAPGQAPTKHLLVRPLDAVQWSIYYPGIFSYRDIPFPSASEAIHTAQLPPALATLVQQGEAAYNRDDLAAAKSAAKDTLRESPDNGRALTLLGWVALQEFAPQEAQGYFSRVRQPDDMAVIGLALARYRLGNPSGAYELITQARRHVRHTWLLTAMNGYFALMVGKVDEARGLLDAAAIQRPESGLPRALLAQIELAQNRKDAARALASQALSQAPTSPLANLTMGLVDIASFDLKAAQTRLEKAMDLDRRFVEAYVYLAKIWLGSEYLDRAQRTIDRALALDSRDPDVLSLAGFVRLAFRDFDAAYKFFQQAVQASPSLGEPHLGLSIYHFRHRDYKKGLEEALTATLLDPRVSLYQTELGKALYQSRSFGKALEVYDYAKTLDPKDPTPYLYKGIALTDLNRPGEAVQEINKSIELNDNVALFKTRLALDRDRAVRNTNLARSYQQLGLQEWAFSKAVTAVKNDPTNSSAHLFLRDSFDVNGPFFDNGLFFSARESEALLYRMLAPANQNTFSSLSLKGAENLGLTFDYTPMYEMPYARLIASGGVGAWEGSKSIQDHQGWLYGGWPGAAFLAGGTYTNDSGFRDLNGNFRLYTVQGDAKWSPTVNGTFTALYEYVDQKTGDRNNLNDFSYTTDNRSTGARLGLYELGYYYQFNPQVGFLAYYAHRHYPFHVSLEPFPAFFPGAPFTQTFDREIDNVQFQQYLTWGRHSFIAGFDYFNAKVTQGFKFDPLSINFEFRPPNWSYSFYLLDYWRMTPNLVVELGVFKDFTKDVVVGFPGTLYNSLWSPRFGVNYQFRVADTQHTLRLALERHLTTHFTAQPLLVPSEIASFTWALDGYPGAEVRQAGAAWESQWNPKTFTTLRLDALRVANPYFNDNSNPVWYMWKRYQASLALNRILTQSLGLSLAVIGKRFVPDPSLQFVADFNNLQAYSEIDASLGLSYLHPQGWLAGVKTFLVQQYLKGRADNPFGLVNLRLGRELPNKRGLILFNVNNLFNRHFYYALEPRRDIEFFPARTFLFRLALYF
jgi:tetratricopeptide (TPR) repeat protein